MNHWTQLSIEFANQRNYLDELFKIYPTIPEGIRDINKKTWNSVEIAYNQNKVYETVFKCSRCRDLLEPIDEEEDFSKYPCPKCGKYQLNISENLMWD